MRWLQLNARQVFALSLTTLVGCFEPGDGSEQSDGTQGTGSAQESSSATLALTTTNQSTQTSDPGPGASSPGEDSADSNPQADDSASASDSSASSSASATAPGTSSDTSNPDESSGTSMGESGEPVGCLDDIECPDITPRCESGECRSCTEVVCEPELELRESMALACQISLQRPGSQDDLTVALCAGTPENASIIRGVLAGLRSGRATSAATRLRQCMAEYEVPFRYEYCLLQETPSRNPAIFGGAFLALPTVPAAGMCRANADCITAECTLTGPCEGTCRARGSRNFPCSSDASCVSGQICYDDSNGYCVDQPPSSGPCLFNSICVDDFYCDENRTCQPLGSENETCTNVRGCEIGLYCRTDDVCRPLPGNGSACVNAFPFLNACALDARCVPAVNECRTAQADGSPCNANQPCRYGSVCSEGACHRVLLRNETCDAESVCAPGLSCIEGRCQTDLPDLGEECTERCARGRCVQSRCVADGTNVDCTPAVLGVLDSCAANLTCSVACLEPDPEGGCNISANRCQPPGPEACTNLE